MGSRPKVEDRSEEQRLNRTVASDLERADHGVPHKRRREGDDEDEGRSSLDSSSHDAAVSGKDPEDEPFPKEALLTQCMLQRDDPENEDEVERVVLTMNEEGAARDATPNPERLVLAGR